MANLRDRHQNVVAAEGFSSAATESLEECSAGPAVAECVDVLETAETATETDSGQSDAPRRTFRAVVESPYGPLGEITIGADCVDDTDYAARADASSTRAEESAGPMPAVPSLAEATAANGGSLPRIWPPLSPDQEEKAARHVLPSEARNAKPLPAERDGIGPYNRTTGVEYRGKNPMRLLIAECEHEWPTAEGWAGFRQWIDHGRVVRRGESSTVILTMVTVTDRKTGDLKTVPGKARRVFHYRQTVELGAEQNVSEE